MDQSLVDRCSSIAYRHAKETFADAAPGIRIEGEDGGFANILRISGARLAITSDGIGTKIEVAERVGRFDTLGTDLLAMVVDDLVAVGAEPLAVSNIIDADRLDAETIDAMMRGLADAARACGVAVTGGEIACLGSRVGGYGSGSHVNWCATALGVIPDGRDPISGRAIEAGDAVVALRNVGLRSNGLTLARSILDRAFGPLWHLERAVEGRWGDLLLSPSVVYARGVVEVLRSGADVHGIAHITGGGIPSNLGRIVAGRGLGATLDTLYAPDSLAHRARARRRRPAGRRVRAVEHGQWNAARGAEEPGSTGRRDIGRAPTGGAGRGDDRARRHDLGRRATVGLRRARVPGGIGGRVGVEHVTVMTRDGRVDPVGERVRRDVRLALQFDPGPIVTAKVYSFSPALSEAAADYLERIALFDPTEREVARAAVARRRPRPSFVAVDRRPGVTDDEAQTLRTVLVDAFGEAFASCRTASRDVYWFETSHPEGVLERIARDVVGNPLVHFLTFGRRDEYRAPTITEPSRSRPTIATVPLPRGAVALARLSEERLLALDARRDAGDRRPLRAPGDARAPRGGRPRKRSY